MVTHNASGFVSWFVLNSLVKNITELKLIITARGLISISFRCGVELFNTIEVPQYVIFTCTKSQMKGSFEKIGREYGLQPEIFKGEIEHSATIKSNLLNYDIFGSHILS